MHYGELKKCDIANGTGVRVTLFVSGCTNRCPGCFQPQTWDFCYGRPYTEATEAEIFAELDKSYVDGLTLLGGEPFEPANPPTLAELLRKVKARYPAKTVWCFTCNSHKNWNSGRRISSAASHCAWVLRVIKCRVYI